MKKVGKVTLIIIVILVGLVLLDTLQARLFKHSPIISWKEEFEYGSWVDKGIIIDTYYCIAHEDTVTVSWHSKTSKFVCPAEIMMKEYEEEKNKLEEEENKLREELQNIQDEQQQLKEELDKLNDPDYLSEYIKDKYSYDSESDSVISKEDVDEKNATE